jgi:hypothetical protein
MGDLNGILDLQGHGDKSDEKNSRQKPNRFPDYTLGAENKRKKVFPIPSMGCRLAGRKFIG